VAREESQEQPDLNRADLTGADLTRAYFNETDDPVVVLEFRYVKGISMVNRDFKRLFLVKTASLYVRIVTGLPGFSRW
jgi:hypothetical protein